MAPTEAPPAKVSAAVSSSMHAEKQIYEAFAVSSTKDRSHGSKHIPHQTVLSSFYLLLSLRRVLFLSAAHAQSADDKLR